MAATAAHPSPQTSGVSFRSAPKVLTVPGNEAFTLVPSSQHSREKDICTLTNKKVVSETLKECKPYNYP